MTKYEVILYYPLNHTEKASFTDPIKAHEYIVKFIDARYKVTHYKKSTILIPEGKSTQYVDNRSTRLFADLVEINVQSK